MDIQKLAWPQVVRDCTQYNFDKLPQAFELDLIREHFAQHLLAHGVAHMPSGVARHVVEAELLATATRVRDRSELQEYCLATLRTDRRLSDESLTVLSSAFEPLRLAFEADECVCMTATADGRFELRAESRYYHSNEPAHPMERFAYAILAQVTAIVGAPIELSNHHDRDPNVVTWARRALTGDATVVCVPVYQREALIAVLCFRRDRLLPPLTRAEWVRNLYLSSDAELVGLIAQEGQAHALLMQSRAHCDWDAYIQVLSRERMPWLPPAPRGASTNPQDWDIFRLYEFSNWLSQLIQRVGLVEPDPQLHPYALKKRLSKAMAEQEASQFSQTAEQTAISLSMQAQQNGWHASVRSMIGELRQQFKRYHTALTLFANYRFEGSFAVMDNLSESIEEREHRIFMILAQVAALLGGPQCIDASNDTNPYFAIARSILEMDDAIISIPVYAWKEPNEVPALHGYFLAIRDAEAPAPTKSEWLQWQFFCQAMHSPLHAMATDPEDRVKRDPVVIQAMGDFKRQG